MLHQVKFATRVFLKDKFYSMLNILGLSLGIAVSIILLLILQNDLTYDRHHILHERIYRLGAHEEGTGVDFWTARAARELGNVLQQELPEVMGVVRANNWNHTLVKYRQANGEEKSWYEEDVVRTDSNYFQLFTHRFIAGDPKTCLVDLNTLVLSQSAAEKYFGDEEALNKELIIDNEVYKVTGVIEDLPENSHLKFDLLLSQLPDREWVVENGMVKSEAYWNPDVFTYILFPENYDPETFYSKFPAIYDKYFKPFGDGVGGKYTPVLEPLADIHFKSTLDGDEPQGNMAYVYAFTGIGLFIILLASINYMNLSTARSVNRAGEIAMRKTLGSGKLRLVVTFLSESVLLSLAAMILALGIVYLVLYATSFNNLIEKTLILDFAGNPLLIIGTMVLTIMIGVISGLYPAFYLPSIPTLKALKGAYKNQKGSLYLRRTLTTAQFAISIFVVVCTLFMQQQIEYVRSTDLGFDKENVVMLNIQDTIVERQIDAIKAEFLQNPNIVSASTSYDAPGINVGGGAVMWAEGADGMKQQAFALMFVGDDYLKTMGLTLIEGRDFQPGRADADRAFIANEAAVKLMNWGEQAVGKKVRFFHDKDETKQVIGVVKDFHWNSLHNNIEPLFLVRGNGEGGWLHLKVSGGNLPETMEFIRKTWTKYDTAHPYEYLFLDQEFDKQYRADEVQYKLLSWLSVICIFISLLGLLGLSAFSATQRTKEIGIRKVHGAAVPQIIYLLYKDVMILVLIATVAVIPVSLYMINIWLGAFAYKAELNYVTFGVVAVLAIAISFLTVAFHSLRTARTNPVVSLKHE